MRNLETSSELEIVYRATSSITHYEKNPRKHGDEKIHAMMDSLEQQGWTSPIEIDENGIILSGHCRHMAAMALNLDVVPTITISGMTGNLGELFTLLDDFDIDAIETGFDIGQISQIIGGSTYQPSVDPISNTQTPVDTDQMEKAENTLNDNIDRPTNDKESNSGTEVICPYCAEEFTIT